MDRDHGVAFLGGLKGRAHRAAFGFEITHARRQCLGWDTFDDRVDEPVDLALDLAGAALKARVILARRVLEAFARGVFIDIGGNHVGMREVVAQAFERDALDVVEVHAPSVVACAAFPVRRALDAKPLLSLPIEDMPPLHRAAFEQPRSQTARLWVATDFARWASNAEATLRTRNSAPSLTASR